MTDTEKLRERLRNTPIETTAYEGKCIYMYLNESDIYRILQACKESGLKFVPDELFSTRVFGDGFSTSQEVVEALYSRIREIEI